MKSNALNKDIKQLCPICKTGRDTYLLDERSPFCPYLICHSGTACAMFVLIVKKEGMVFYVHRKKY